MLTFHKNYVQHQVFEGVAAKNAGRVASNEPPDPFFGPSPPPTDPQEPHPNGSEGSVGSKAGFEAPNVPKWLPKRAPPRTRKLRTRSDP